MAILKTSLEESLLSRSEQSVLRTVLIVSQLQEGIIQLDKLNIVVSTAASEATSVTTPLAKVIQIKEYLSMRINSHLTTIRLPDQTPSKETKVPSKGLGLGKRV